MKPKSKPHDSPDCPCDGCRRSMVFVFPASPSEWRTFINENGLIGVTIPD